MKFTIYDFDGTIYDGDSSIDFFLYCLKRKPSIIFHLPKMGLYTIKYKLKFISKDKMKECFFEILKKFNNIDDIVKQFWETHDYKIKVFFRNKKNHKNDIISSASPIFLLTPIKEKYKVYDLFGTPVNKHTGLFEGKNCRDVEKVKLLNKKYPNCIVEYMYSDSLADTPLLELAKKSFIVKKNKIIDYKEYINKKTNVIKRFWDWGWSIYHKNEEVWNYLIIGFLTTIVSLIIYFTLVNTIINPNNSIELQIANIISWIISVLFAYVTNRIFVFKSKEKNIKKEATKFIGSRLLTLLLDMLIMFIFVSLLKFNDKIMKIISQILIIIGNYIISKLIVFKKKD